MNSLAQDLRYALRTYARNRGLTFTLLLLLALGIGGTTTMFSVLNGVILRPLPYSHPDRIALLPGASYAEIETWAEAPSMAHLAVYATGGVNLTGETEAKRIQAAAVTSGFFAVLEVAPQFGRSFGKQDEIAGNHRVALLSDGMWAQSLGSDPRAVGSVIHLNGIPHTIVGVMPQGFTFPGQTALWVPASEHFHSTLLGSRDQPELPDFLDSRMLGRLRDGATFDQASAELEILRQRLKKQYEQTNKGVTSSVRAVALHRMLTWEVRPALILLFVAAIFVLLIACANAASLLLARAATRQKEAAIRLCLGAGPGRITRLFLAEGVLIAVVSGALGVLLAYWGVDLIRTISPAKVPRISEVRVDLAALSFAFSISLLVGVLAGLVPALAATRKNLTETLKQEGMRTTSGGHRVRSILVTAEVALALVLLTGATLMIQSFFRLTNVSPGIDTRNAVTMTLGIPPARLTSPAALREFYDRLAKELAAVPGVAAVGGASRLPLSEPGGYQWLDLGGGASVTGQESVVLGNYFSAIGIPVLAGRTFTEAEGPGAPPVVIVNQVLARRISPDGKALGLQFRIGPESFLREIVGIVGNVRQGGLEEPEKPQFYVPYFQPYLGTIPRGDPRLVIRTATNPDSLVPAIRARLHALDRDLVVFRLKTMEQVVSQSTAPLRFRAQLMGIFSSLALVLAVLGVYGLVSYSVASRTREIGVRMALGAERANIVRMVLLHGARLAVAGAVIGAGAAWGLSRFLTRLLFGISPTDLTSLTVSSVALVLAALAACLVPALRASRVEPAAALRYE